MPAPPRSRVVFDEAHSEAWTIRPELASLMQPSHPADASYALAAEALRERDFDVAANVDQPLSAETLERCDMLVIAHPSEPAWERTTGVGSSRLNSEEIDAIDAFVRAGGGLIVLGETEQEKYGNNLNELLARFGLRLENDTVQDYEHHAGAPSWILADLAEGGRGRDGDLLARVHEACLYRATTITLDGHASDGHASDGHASDGHASAGHVSDGHASDRHPSDGHVSDGHVSDGHASDGHASDRHVSDGHAHPPGPLQPARVLARSHASASIPGAPLIVAAEHGQGHVALLADSDLFGDDCIDQLDHRALWLNLVYWLVPTHPVAARRESAPAGAAVTDDEAWARLRDQTNALALLQAPDGSLAAERDRRAAQRHAEEIVPAIEELAPRFPHQADYLRAAVDDLRAWVSGGFGKPDFTRALALFRPEQQRTDGIEHLVFFPMYKQNASRETRFEALVVRVPWPDWVAELERTRFDNAKFVPVQLVDATLGYDSECAVLFPETVSAANGPINNFGAIFCDREAERLRRIVGTAADLLRLNLPPDAAWMLRSRELSEQAYILWDLIHDRAHSHGDLPFDPFMIRQRAPYWMYSLEELRCDLTAFVQAVELELDPTRPLRFARYVQYAILLDRLLRFPITGTRVRNYDGLGGQLLFAYLHRRGFLHWTDNRLTIEWERVADGVRELHAEVHELYRSGIDRTKLQHWAASHDLVAANVPSATGSQWAANVRTFADVEDPRPYVDLVLDDEFPLSIFYSSLKAKLAA